jgi:hypothetical protein
MMKEKMMIGSYLLDNISKEASQFCAPGTGRDGFVCLLKVGVEGRCLLLFLVLIFWGRSRLLRESFFLDMVICEIHICYGEGYGTRSCSQLLVMMWGLS